MYRRGFRDRVPVSAGSKLAAARKRLERLEHELEAGQAKAAAPARSLLRQILPYVRHKTDCNSRDRRGGEECTCELDDIRDEIAELLQEE